MQANQEELARAFNEWLIRWQENPDEFTDIQESTPGSYGESCAMYLEVLLNELFPRRNEPAFGISRLVQAGIVPHYAQKVIVEFGTDEFVTVHAKYAVDDEKLSVVEAMAKEAMVLRGDDYLLAVKETEDDK